LGVGSSAVQLKCSIPLCTPGPDDMWLRPPPPSNFSNPDGDGVFRVTLRNSSRESILIPCLLMNVRTKRILWEESLLVSYNGRAREQPGIGLVPHPRSLGVTGCVIQAVCLQPGQAVSHDINVLEQPGRNWPCGGARIPVSFVLGEMVAEPVGEQYRKFRGLYYLSRHHDPKLDMARKARKAYVWQRHSTVAFRMLVICASFATSSNLHSSVGAVTVSLSLPTAYTQAARGGDAESTKTRVPAGTDSDTDDSLGSIGGFVSADDGEPARFHRPNAAESGWLTWARRAFFNERLPPIPVGMEVIAKFKMLWDVQQDVVRRILLFL